MSVVCWDGHTLAADKRATLGSLIRTTTKIRRIGEFLCGYSGDAAQGEEMLAWFARGAIASEFPASQRDKDDWAGLLVIGRGSITRYERTPYPLHYEDVQFAIGSGRDFALAAMHCGKTAREAVEIACIFDNGCGNGVDALEFVS